MINIHLINCIWEILIVSFMWPHFGPVVAPGMYREIYHLYMMRLIQSMFMKCQRQSACWLQPEWRVRCQCVCSPRLRPPHPYPHPITIQGTNQIQYELNSDDDDGDDNDDDGDNDDDDDDDDYAKHTKPC